MAGFRFPGIIPQIGDYAHSLPIGFSALGNLLIDDILFPSGYQVTLWSNTEPLLENSNAVISDGTQITAEKIGWTKKGFIVTIPFSCQACEFVITQKKNIVTTYVSGRNGSVKEFTGMGDYEISLTGKISNINSVFPAEMLGLFHELTKVPHSIPIQNKFINKLDINKVVISEFSVNPIVGSLNEFEFSMTLVSDDDDINFEKYIL